VNRLFSCLLCFCSSIAWVSAAQLETLLPFASADSVRIEAVVDVEEDAGPAQVTGRIVEATGQEVLWQGALGEMNLQRGAAVRLTNTISNLQPRLWTPDSPALYTLEVTARIQGRAVAAQSVRFGFRSFGQSDGQFLLNGRPLFLRGIAINPPGRTIPKATGESRAFAEAYVRSMKAAHVNIIRLGNDSQVWFDVCDELGMMVYQGDYGAPPGGDKKKEKAPANYAESLAAYKKLFSTYARHPAIVIYILANELPAHGKRGKAFAGFLEPACADLKAWDSTRQYIANAGFGEGRQGDIQDVHRYWGWYYNTFLTFYNLRNPHLFGDPSKVQPLTFTECVGCFTGPQGGFNLVERKQLGPQLNWTGHSAEQAEDAAAYQCRVVREVTEAFRRLRTLNKHIAGVMPFSIFFANWSGISSFAQMHATAALEQLGRSYQPLLLSWEMWTPQVYAGSMLRTVAHVINDADDGSNLTNAILRAEIRSADGRVTRQSASPLGDIPYYGARSTPLSFALPDDLPTGDYTLTGKILSGSREISSNAIALFVAGADWNKATAPREEAIHLFDPTGRTAAALRQLRIPFQRQKSIAGLVPSSGVLVIGEEAWTRDLAAQQDKLKKFVLEGGRILCLRQGQKMDTAWLPETIHFFTASPDDPKYPVKQRPFAANMCINPERPDHPVFAGLDRHRLELWSDYTGWDQTKRGFPRIYPVTGGFALDKTKSLEHTAILADHDCGLEGVALCEMFAGKGSVILSAFDLVNRSGLDPAADRLLRNLVGYSASTSNHFAHPLIEEPIQWGDYASERGLVPSPLNGLIVNADWVAPPTNPSEKPLTQAQGRWNTRPGDSFLADGRSPVGVYEFVPFAAPKLLDPDEKIGRGFIWARIPSGKTIMVTKVMNPARTEGELAISVNQKDFPPPARIAPGQTATVQSPLPGGTSEVAVGYAGSTNLVIQETRFE
jgi:beta-galactosidase